jgi:large subunit ribosomal protein L15
VIELPTRLRKTRKHRGTRTCGWGRVGQHRKSGRKGGRGKAGMHKHKWTYTVKYAPDHFKKDDFKPPLIVRNIVDKWVNVGQLDDLFLKLKEEGEIKGRSRTINLHELGVKKLLGEGSVKGKYQIIVEFCSKKAKEKVEKVGGKIVLLEEAKVS